MADKPTYYTVIHSFASATDDYQEGEVLEAGDPAIKKWPMNFAPLVVRGKTIEQATAAPDEVRDLPPQGKAITTASFKGR
jgi:hypothetical protein